ncbi:MAG: aminopeptidase [Halobacteriales archaeon]
MDPRVNEHAEVLVDWGARVEAGDHVVVRVSEGAHDLAVAVAAALGERGATVTTTYASDEVRRAYLLAAGEAVEPAAPTRAMYEAADVTLALGGGRNTAALADVPPATRRAHATATKAIRELRLATDWMATVHPTRSLAQQAGMGLEAYRDFVYGAVLRDWSALAAEMDRLKRRLDGGDEVRIEAPGTDVTLRIDGRTAVNSAASVVYDSHNLPSGEVYTAPYGAEGEATFDVPMTIRGQEVRDVRLRFDDGEVVDHDALVGADVIAEILETDAGARRLGELGVGMNRGIDRPTDNVMFDEKLAGTVHLALGRAYDACLPAGVAGNDSAVHVDLIADLRSGGQLSIDGGVVLRDGRFAWEPGFEGG